MNYDNPTKTDGHRIVSIQRTGDFKKTNKEIGTDTVTQTETS